MTPIHALRTATLIALACTALACRREEPAPTDMPQTPAETAAPAAAAAPGPTPVPGTDALSVSENTVAESGVQPVADAARSPSPRDFAGTFAAQDTRLELLPDGSYRMSAASPGAQAAKEGDGTWAFAADGKSLLLDPNSKDDADQRLQIVSNDELSGDGQSLRRQAP